MDNVNFNTPAGSKPERNTLILYLNTGTAQEPVWSAVGLGVEESSMEYDWSEKTERDILGNVRTTIKKPKITQKFEPCNLDSSDNAQAMIWNQAIRHQDMAAMTNNDLFAIADGMTVIENFLFGVLDMMDESVTENISKRDAKIRKYTEKYRKYRK